MPFHTVEAAPCGRPPKPSPGGRWPRRGRMREKDFACGRDREKRFRLRAAYFARGGKVGKTPPGAAHGHLTMPYPASPGPPLFLRESHQEGGQSSAGAGRNQNGCLCADRCRSVPVEQPLAPTRSDAPNFLPSRRARADGSAAGTCAGLAETGCKTYQRSGAAPASAFRHLPWPLAVERSRAPLAPGGTSNRGDRSPPCAWSF